MKCTTYFQVKVAILSCTIHERNVFIFSWFEGLGMSPVSPVFHAALTVSIGLKNVLRMVLRIHSIILDVYVES